MRKNNNVPGRNPVRHCPFPKYVQYVFELIDEADACQCNKQGGGNQGEYYRDHENVFIGTAVCFLTDIECCQDSAAVRKRIQSTARYGNNPMECSKLRRSGQLTRPALNEFLRRKRNIDSPESKVTESAAERYGFIFRFVTALTRLS